eukprot:TRINITY_DN7571_c0_g1_i1.p1 TRINITY_DN7571_c0_g1~~TRINITY_DN7571_c0_g1_i1.p1  ORF type:complete len:374 (+),score=77.72 TRINITY_DN7571_c0_g1_i1:23-1144(+)
MLRSVFVAFLLCAFSVTALAFTCPCADSSLCAALDLPPRKELFTFQQNKTNWVHYDWTHLTTIVMFEGLDPPFLCEAHAHKVRLAYGAFYPGAQLLNTTYRDAWVSQQVELVASTFVDGINIDTESAVVDAPLVKALTDVTRMVTEALQKRVPHSVVTFDVAWSPDCIDKRCYDYVSLSQIVDLLFIMAYDEQSQIWPPRACKAYPNDPISNDDIGIRKFLALGIPASKLVLGVPWYAYDYPCINYDATTPENCFIKAVPFRDCPCSDAAGKQLDYRVMIERLQQSTTERRWNSESKTPWFNYIKTTSANEEVVHQVHYDDPESLTYKYQLARSHNLRGIGMWYLDALDYWSSDETIRKQTRDMWAAMNVFFD